MAIDVSVVIATYNRKAALLGLLNDLALQEGIAPDRFEAIVVDDGSREPVRAAAEASRPPFRLRVLEQANAGQAAARHAGILAAEGELVLLLDDDMRAGPDLIRGHVAAHRDLGLDVAIGVILPSDRRLPFYERWHARQIERFAESVRDGRAPVTGADLTTGNVSFTRRAYLACGGFDASLAQSEDRELGIRLEREGARIGVAEQARTIHRSDHSSLARWRERAFGYGVWDHRIARKHPGDENADPWKFLFRVNRVSRPLLALAAAAPRAGVVLERVAIVAAAVADRAKLEGPAMAGTTLAYGLAYFRGVRSSAGSLPDAARDLGRYLVKRGRQGLRRGEPSAAAAAADLAAALEADFDAHRRGREKYLHDEVPATGLPGEVVRRIGLQMVVAVRLMRFLRDCGSPVGARVACRLIRHLYGAEIHWDAEIAPGASIVHGNGLVLSHAARVGEGCVLYHNVTLGHAVDRETGEAGAPLLGRNVHVGPGAMLLGPIVVGDGSKIAAGAVLTESVPTGSLVRPPLAAVEKRRASRAPYVAPEAVRPEERH